MANLPCREWTYWEVFLEPSETVMELFGKITAGSRYQFSQKCSTINVCLGSKYANSATAFEMSQQDIYIYIYLGIPGIYFAIDRKQRTRRDFKLFSPIQECFQWNFHIVFCWLRIASPRETNKATEGERTYWL